jgi:hypothetical protein
LRHVAKAEQWTPADACAALLDAGAFDEPVALEAPARLADGDEVVLRALQAAGVGDLGVREGLRVGLAEGLQDAHG